MITEQTNKRLSSLLPTLLALSEHVNAAPQPVERAVKSGFPPPSPANQTELSRTFSPDESHGFCEVYSERWDGPGPPAAWYLHKQMTETIRCGPAGCSATASFAHTVGWSASVGISVPWTNGGLAVEESWTWESSYTCNGGPGDVVCVWYSIAHTAYWAREYRQDPTGTLTCPGPSLPFVIFSPNRGNRGMGGHGDGGYYCVINSCRGVDDQYWDDDGAI